MGVKMGLHLNGCQMCAIDVETTGLDPNYHEIWQLAIVPLDNNLNPVREKILDLYIQPRYPHRREGQILPLQGPSYQQACDSGVDPDVALDIFDAWFIRLNLGEDRRITPLAHNWGGFEHLFLREWMGVKHVATYFDSRVRDLLIACNFVNDYCDMNGQIIKFQGVRALTLKKIAENLDIDTKEMRYHDALHDAVITTMCYKKLTKEFFI